MWDADETLRTLPPYYAAILRGQFNSWLRQRYESDEALAAAWGKGTEPLGQSLLQNGDFLSWDAGASTPGHWNLEQHEGCQATLSRPRGIGQDAMQVDIAKANDTQWHLQLTQGGFAVTEGRYYTLSFEAAGQATRRISCSREPGARPLGQSRALAERGPEHGMADIPASASSPRPIDDNARVSFAFSGDPTPFQLARRRLAPGGQVGLAEGESPSAKQRRAVPRQREHGPHPGPDDLPGRDGEGLLRRHAILHQEGPRLQGPRDRDDRLRPAGPVRPERHGLHRQSRLLAASQLPRPALGLGQLAHRAESP